MTGKKTARKVHAAFSEVKKNPPAILAKTRKKEGPAQARRQEIAISLSKARSAGARIPAPKGMRNMVEGK